MTFAIVSVIALFTIGAIAYIFTSVSRKPGAANDEIVVAPADCSTCSGDNAKCEQECMMEAATKPVEYFDDEELDAFKGRPSNDYTNEEVEQFGYVMHTMQPEEVKAWGRSLTLRGIQLPDQLKDEFVMLIEE